MSKITTVLGPIEAESLGITHMHEHIIIDVYPTRWGYNAVLDDIGVSREEIMIYKKAGGQALVEQTMRGAGRDPAGLRRLSVDTGVHIVASTSFVWSQFGSPDSNMANTKNANELADIMIQDIVDGMDGTDVRAGCIGEIAAGGHRSSAGNNYISPTEERLFRAAARAHKQTGLALYTHTNQGMLALEQIELLQEEGVDMQKVVIGHLGDRNAIDYYEAIADKGVNLGFDHVGHCRGTQVYAPDALRATNIAEMIERGHLEQIVLSQDLFLKEMWHYNGGIGYDYLLTKFVPILVELGVKNEHLECMLMKNPARILGT